MPSKKWEKIAEMYLLFLEEDWKSNLDFSDAAKEEMFLFESQGIGKPNRKNAYFLGKCWMDVNIEMWKKGIDDGLLFPFELLEDFPSWFLIKIGILDKNYAK